MITRNVKLDTPSRFEAKHTISRQKLENAISDALDKVDALYDKMGDGFVVSSSRGLKYPIGTNDNWVCGMYAGLFLLAYEFTGKKSYLDIINKHLKSFKDRCDGKIAMSSHDVGFVFSPSCVGAYKVLGDTDARDTALEAARHLYEYSYSQKGGFILRIAGLKDEVGCRTMMDSLLNSPLLFWAGNETGNEEYIKAGLSQAKVTEKYLIRDDGSSFHHYIFDPETHEPVRGLTFQGYSDSSTWSRGHSWGVCGLPITYAYTGDESVKKLHRYVTYYYLNHLPEDLIPYWDFTFTSGDEPRDCSAAAIGVCGLDEMCKHLGEGDSWKSTFSNASAAILESLIDRCAVKPQDEAEGLIYPVAGAVPQKLGINECAMYGDFFYLEALMRFYNPSWKMYW